MQLIECPTHIHGNILDLILTNTDDLIQNVVVLPHNLYPVQSDHFLVNFSMSISEQSLSNITLHYVYDYSKADFEGLDAYIFNSNLLECLTSQYVEYVWSKIFSTLSDAMDIYIPKFRLHSHQFPKWFSAELRHRLKCLRTLRRKYKRSLSNHNFECLCMAEEIFNKMLKTASLNMKLI